MGKHTHEGGVELRKMKTRRDHSKDLAEEAIEENMIQQTEVKGLKKFLEDT